MGIFIIFILIVVIMILLIFSGFWATLFMVLIGAVVCGLVIYILKRIFGG